MNASSYWVYLLHCDNDTYYTGYTNNLERRYQQHVLGTGKCKYTRSFKPLSLAQSWQFNSKSAAMKAESLIKKLSRKEKDQLVLQPELLRIVSSHQN